MKTISQAKELATTMVNIGKSLNRDTVAIISDMSEPLGNAVGNSLEIKEVIESLHGRGPSDLLELCFSSGAIMLKQAKIVDSEIEARDMLKNAITSGKAFETFCQMVKAQGGDVSYILDPSKFEVSKNIIPIYADKDGYIQSINALVIGESAMKLGAGRETLDDVIDPSAGVVLNKKVGDVVKTGDLLATCYTNKSNVDDVILDIKNDFVISSNKTQHINVIKEIIR